MNTFPDTSKSTNKSDAGSVGGYVVGFANKRSPEGLWKHGESGRVGARPSVRSTRRKSLHGFRPTTPNRSANVFAAATCPGVALSVSLVSIMCYALQRISYTCTQRASWPVEALVVAVPARRPDPFAVKLTTDRSDKIY
jgi:hypothetical protein